ncbi:MAG: tRNA lysidine(34) synthetase TilS, partial [Chthoniobacterales bacterium]
MKGNKARCPAEWGRASLANLPKERRYLIGVSGGRDSIVLLHWLLAQGYRRLIVCHFEHGLRGRAGKTDARFVERLAQKHALEFELGSADIAAIAQQAKRSIETTARRERLVFFQRTGRRRRCLTIFLGHHADDQVETFLLNLFRGAAGRGLGAMRERSRYEALEMARPLLGVWRSEIDGYVAQHRLKFREDATNAELGARRNRTRHLIVPWLEKQFGRNLRATIWRSAQVLAEEDAC